ncbi:heavy metal-binding domain-containing protein [Christensenellaceae bacterium OttesenSCG-928-K19]|nr:heavy metal-binding domain-containing protein [Christensenellaceae bacterium OttesenSCG-928-K19]
MILVNVEQISGKEYDVISLVKGNTVQAKNFGRDFMAGMKNLVGGEIKGYTEMLTEAREIAINRMIADAEGMGADAIVNVRFASSHIMDGAAEVIAYGTAVKFK